MKKVSHAPLSIGQFASGSGVSVVTIRRWCRAGKMSEAFRSAGGHRRFSTGQLRELLNLIEQQNSVQYAWVSSHDQKSDLVT
ncbi:MerR family DNA-binding transcriptional regulator [Marinobacter flavimaris]|uniref:MerR family DNA-binding transcriptional regulator n=1 Tax=Marinobacter flavimaris TaxID=262076 RepID=UPI003862FFCA